uniref:SbsA Ig-like domain-containing protein n=1 Tax=Tanacetum cinerariifolium TaxID=118510 RepID=A0A6L2N5Q7_TANCI|nr:hypothetical protein [Tanacetum cinerariifolium]
MKDICSISYIALLSVGLAPVSAAFAQTPSIISVVPTANARAVARTGSITVTFSQPLTAASAASLKVFSQQRGGLRTAATSPAVVSGSTLSFAPASAPFTPGETIYYTVTTAAASSGGNLAQARVGQFTTAVGGAGRGTFLAGSDPNVGDYPLGGVLGDVDGDGDLDLLTVSVLLNTVSVRLNSGSGIFSGNQEIPVGFSPNGLVLGDVDGDGDLDLLTGNYTTSSTSGTVSVRLNNGSGIFSGNQEVLVSPNPGSVVVGDIDGDGDLDLLTANQSALNTVSVRLNNGSGTFGGSQNVAIAGNPVNLVVGDVDGDGDLDLLATSNNTGTVSVRLNNGSGTFAGTQDVGVGTNPTGLALGDIDGDDDLDLLNVSVGAGPRGIALSDLDSDGDLDLVVVGVTTPGVMSIRLNNGSGTFSGGYDSSIGNNMRGVVLGDVDGDGDLDLLAVSNTSPGVVSVRLNGGTNLASNSANPARSFTAFPNPSRTTASFSGTTSYAPVTLFDALGRTVLTTVADATGLARVSLPDGLPAGLYLASSAGHICRLVVE